MILATSTLFGVLFARFIYTTISLGVYYTLLALIIGVLAYTVIRHSIPPGKQGKPAYLIAGVIIYALLIIGDWSLM